MSHPPQQTSVTSLPTGLARGTLEGERWSFSGSVPDGAVRIAIETDTATTYSVSASSRTGRCRSTGETSRPS